MRALTLFIIAGGCDSAIRRVGEGTATFGRDSGAEGGGDVICDRRSIEGQCVVYTGSGWDDESAEGHCGLGIEPGPCPSNHLGGCKENAEDALALVRWYYVGDFYTAADGEFLEASCETNFGIWRD